MKIKKVSCTGFRKLSPLQEYKNNTLSISHLVNGLVTSRKPFQLKRLFLSFSCLFEFCEKYTFKKIAILDFVVNINLRYCYDVQRDKKKFFLTLFHPFLCAY